MRGGEADPVLYECSNGVARITLNRPVAGNAINVALAQGLFSAVNSAHKDTTARCVVVRGNGRMFCGGGDVKALHEAGDERPQLLRDILLHLHPAIAMLAEMEKPVIAAVHGPAAGAGFALALVGDLVLASPDAHFTMAYPRIGLTPDGGNSWLLPRLIGLRRAQELALTNARVSAEAAVAMGLITRVVKREALTQEVDILAQALVRSATRALGFTKKLLMTSATATFRQQLDTEEDFLVAQGGTEESRVGFDAFMERRMADFQSGK